MDGKHTNPGPEHSPSASCTPQATSGGWSLAIAANGAAGGQVLTSSWATTTGYHGPPMNGAHWPSQGSGARVQGGCSHHGGA
jgi:hypothetical protein